MKRFNETYRNRQFITRNQWADTYKAIHADTEEDVILKVLVNQSNDEKYINHLSKEVEKIKKIKNTNMINVNNIFQYSAFGKTYPYIEGEYFKGISLKERMDMAKFSKEESVKIVLALAEVIREFHKENILFNNLSLDNIYINNKDIVKIDALIYLENNQFTKDIEAKETEEIEKEVFTPDIDIYDLGAILHALLSGKYIFEIDKLHKYINDKNLLCVIEKATNNKLENKYTTIGRFIADIKSYLSCGELSSDDMAKEEEIVVKPKRKKGKLKKTLGICATIAIVAGGFVYGYDLLQKNNNIENNKAEIVNEKTDKEKEKNEEKIVNEATEETIEQDVNVDKNNTTTTSNNTNNNNELTGSNTSNNSSNNTGNNTSTNNSQNSGNINTTPNEGSNNDSVNQTTEIPSNPTPDNSGDNSGGSETVTPEVTPDQSESE